LASDATRSVDRQDKLTFKQADTKKTRSDVMTVRQYLSASDHDNLPAGADPGFIEVVITVRAPRTCKQSNFVASRLFIQGVAGVELPVIAGAPTATYNSLVSAWSSHTVPSV